MAENSLKWLVFLIIATITTVSTWHFAPKLKGVLPERAVKTAEAIVAATRGDLSLLAKTNSRPVVERRVIFVNKDGTPYTNKVISASSATSSNKAVSAENKDNKKDQTEKPPSFWGINRVHTLKAEWAVLQKTTPVMKLDDKVMGNAPAGAVFFVQKRISTPSGTIYEGQFNSTKMTKTVRIDSKYVVSFSGDYNKLSENQKTALKKYYELNGKAEERKAEVLKGNLTKSPYLEQAAEALRKYNTASKRFKQIKDAPEDFRREATYRLSQLKDKVQELNQKHKEWKESHQSELNDYINDPKYIEIIAEREKFHDEIPGLAY